MDEAAIKTAIKNLIAWLHADRGADEDQARRLLTDVLRTERPLDLGLRFTLADLFDPDSRDDLGCCLTIKKMRGNRKSRLNSRLIAARVWKATRNGCKLKLAVKDAAGECRCHESTVYEAWSRWNPWFKKNPALAR